MAEIHIERKKGAAWPWLLLAALAVLAVLLWLLWPDAADTTPLTATIVDPIPVPVSLDSTAIASAAMSAMADHRPRSSRSDS